MKCLSKSKSYDDDIEEPCVSEDSGLWSHLHRRDFAREFQPEIFQKKKTLWASLSAGSKKPNRLFHSMQGVMAWTSESVC